MHVVTGDTFKHKEAIKAAGGKWDAERKVWQVPAGASLPAGLNTTPLGDHLAKWEPDHAQVGKTAYRDGPKGKEEVKIKDRSGPIVVKDSKGQAQKVWLERVSKTYTTRMTGGSAGTVEMERETNPRVLLIREDGRTQTIDARDEAEAEEKYRKMLAQIRGA